MAIQLNTSRSNTRRTASDEQDEYQGLWLNVGVNTTIEAEDGSTDSKFVRLPRGIAVSDLANHKVYENTNPEWAQQATMANTIMDIIREKGMKLEEGEGQEINLVVQLYRKQETSEVSTPKADVRNLEAQLFDV